MTRQRSWDVYQSPLGPLTLVTGPRGLSALRFPGRGGPLDGAERRPSALAEAAAQLEEYFAGARRGFDLELDLGGTPFERAVWGRLLEIPHGATITYTQLAHAVGRPDIVRGVAAAVGRTPVPIIVPCHRVVAADGGLRGYSGGLHRKRALLDLEGGLARAAEAPRQLALL
jgi:methylated-DNA-[protein]-cysteine S-methyltransferase